MKHHTIDDLPPVIWNVHVVGPGGLGLSKDAQRDYFDAVERRIAKGAEVLGTTRWAMGSAEGLVVTEPVIASDTPLKPKHVPVLISHWGGRKTLPGSRFATFHQLTDDLACFRAVNRLRRRQVDPVILGTGFPNPTDPDGMWGQDPRYGDHVDAVADYLEHGFALQIDDAMGRPEELGQIVAAARDQAGLRVNEGIVMAESATLNNRARWNHSNDFDRGALYGNGPWIIRAGTFGRSVLLKHSVQVIHASQCPIYLLVTGQDNLTADEVARFRELGYDRFVLQGVGIGSPVAAEAREILKNWREARQGAEEPAGLGVGSEVRRGE